MTATALGLLPFDVLFDGASSGELPADLRSIYGSNLDLNGREPTLFANFVQSIDGIVALADGTSSGSVISGKSAADRFVMGLLRAQADAVLIGAGTLRDSPGHVWTAEYVYPDFADAFRELRKARGLGDSPRTVLITSSGEIDVTHRGLANGVTIVTTARGQASLPTGLPAGSTVHVLGESGPVDLDQALKLLRSSGLRSILTEAGPSVNRQLIDRGLLEDLFLTISPVVAGSDGEQKGFASGIAFLPDAGIWPELVSCRRSGSYLFLRYSLR